MNNGEPRAITLYRVARDRQTELYRELVNVWDAIERKAQGIIAISGVFVAATFAFIRQLAPGSNGLEALCLLASVFFLITSLALALSALWVSGIKSPPFSLFSGEVMTDLLTYSGHEYDEQFAGVLEADHEAWCDLNKDIDDKNLRKAKRLLLAQISLCAAIAFTAALVTQRTYSNWRSNLDERVPSSGVQSPSRERQPLLQETPPTVGAADTASG